MHFTGGEDGLIYYRNILKKAKKALKNDGVIFLEIGYMQKEDIFNIAKENGYSYVECAKDLEGRDRVIKIKR